MTIIAYKKVALESPNEMSSNVSLLDGLLKEIESLLRQEAGIENPLGNIWQLSLSAGLRHLPEIHKIAQKYRGQIAVLVSEDSTLAVL